MGHSARSATDRDHERVLSLLTQSVAGKEGNREGRGGHIQCGRCTEVTGEKEPRVRQARTAGRRHRESQGSKAQSENGSELSVRR